MVSVFRGVQGKNVTIVVTSYRPFVDGRTPPMISRGVKQLSTGIHEGGQMFDVNRGKICPD